MLRRPKAKKSKRNGPRRHRAHRRKQIVEKKQKYNQSNYKIKSSGHANDNKNDNKLYGIYGNEGQLEYLNDNIAFDIAQIEGHINYDNHVNTQTEEGYDEKEVEFIANDKNCQKDLAVTIMGFCDHNQNNMVHDNEHNISLTEQNKTITLMGFCDKKEIKNNKVDKYNRKQNNNNNNNTITMMGHSSINEHLNINKQ